MNSAIYLQWHYMIFLAPMAASALLLLLSSLRIGGHRGHAHHGGGMRHVGGGMRHAGGGGGVRHHGGASGGGHRASHGGTAKTAHRTASGAKPTARNGRSETTGAVHMPTATSFLLTLLGIGRAPAPLVAEMFCLCWGAAGFCAVSQLVPAGEIPSLGRMLPSLGIALGGGLVGARVSAELLARLLPKDETAVVSRNGLFGLTGTVVYPVTATGGRIHVYDDFRTLHDESCRLAPDCTEIPKGHHARIVDVDATGNLIVEEAPEPVRLA